jgi:transcriptional regulator with XRE-family HTH domain
VTRTDPTTPPKQASDEHALLLATLKRVLREQGIPYRELARRLGLSEPTIKRVFSTRQLTLERLSQICSAVGITLFELSRRAERTARDDVYQLTIAQERRLVRETELFYFFWMLVSRHSLASIRRRYRISDAKVRRYLAELHAIGIVDQRSPERFELKVPSHVVWNADGPIERLMVQRSVPAFLRGRFRGETEHFRFIVGSLTPRSAALFREQLAELVDRIFAQSVREDAMRPDARRTGTLVAFGPMDFSLRDVMKASPSE